MRSEAIKTNILTNSEEIRKLHRRIHETFRDRDKSREQYELWERACEEFHARYDVLAFPGGYSTAAERMAQADAEAIESALCFVELRPYFFRSGYMFKTLLRKLKRASLNEKQASH